MSRRTLVRIAVGIALTVLVGIGAVTWRMRHFGTTICPRDRADIYAIEAAAENYAGLNAGAFPQSLEELVRPDENGRSYLRITTPPRDPYGRPYLYEPPDAEFPFPRIWTYGRDGLPGGEEADQDFGNWMFRQ